MCFELKKSLSLTLLAPLLIAGQVSAVQLIPNADRQSVQVNISAREANRLAIEGRRIATVVPAQAGLLTIKKDEASGAMFFTMAPADQSAIGTVSVFVTDDQNISYKLILVPRPIPAEEIIIQPPADKTAAAAHPEARATSYQRRIKDLILGMSDAETGGAEGADKVDINKDVPLWKEGRLTLVARYLAPEIVGERYRLTNVAATPMLVEEQEFFRRGVRAVSIKNQTLPPGESTDIYIVRERKEHE